MRIHVLPGLLLLIAAVSYGQVTSGSGTVRGSVLDPSGAVIKGATVEIQNPVSGYDMSTTTDGQGNFELDNVPYNNYHLSATATGFQGSEQDINVRSPLPVEVKLPLTIGAANETVTVTKPGILSKPIPRPIRMLTGIFSTSCLSKAIPLSSVLW